MSSEWRPLNEEKSTLDYWFNSIDRESAGVIGGARVVNFLRGSNLHKDTLRKIWEVTDGTNQGKINRAQFYKLVRLTTVCLNTPNSVPSHELYVSTIHQQLLLPPLSVSKDIIDGPNRTQQPPPLQAAHPGQVPHPGYPPGAYYYPPNTHVPPYGYPPHPAHYPVAYPPGTYPPGAYPQHPGPHSYPQAAVPGYPAHYPMPHAAVPPTTQVMSTPVPGMYPPSQSPVQLQSQSASPNVNISPQQYHQQVQYQSPVIASDTVSHHTSPTQQSAPVTMPAPVYTAPPAALTQSVVIDEDFTDFESAPVATHTALNPQPAIVDDDMGDFMTATADIAMTTNTILATAPMTAVTTSPTKPAALISAFEFEHINASTALSKTSPKINETLLSNNSSPTKAATVSAAANKLVPMVSDNMRFLDEVIEADLRVDQEQWDDFTDGAADQPAPPTSAAPAMIPTVTSVELDGDGDDDHWDDFVEAPPEPLCAPPLVHPSVINIATVDVQSDASSVQAVRNGHRDSQPVDDAQLPNSTSIHILKAVSRDDYEFGDFDETLPIDNPTVAHHTEEAISMATAGDHSNMTISMVSNTEAHTPNAGILPLPAPGVSMRMTLQRGISELSIDPYSTAMTSSKSDARVIESRTSGGMAIAELMTDDMSAPSDVAHMHHSVDEDDDFETISPRTEPMAYDIETDKPVSNESVVADEPLVLPVSNSDEKPQSISEIPTDNVTEPFEFLESPESIGTVEPTADSTKETSNSTAEPVVLPCPSPDFRKVSISDAFSFDEPVIEGGGATNDDTFPPMMPIIVPLNITDSKPTPSAKVDLAALLGLTTSASTSSFVSSKSVATTSGSTVNYNTNQNQSSMSNLASAFTFEASDIDFDADFGDFESAEPASEPTSQPAVFEFTSSVAASVVATGIPESSFDPFNTSSRTNANVSATESAIFTTPTTEAIHSSIETTSAASATNAATTTKQGILAVKRESFLQSIDFNSIKHLSADKLESLSEVLLLMSQFEEALACYKQFTCQQLIASLNHKKQEAIDNDELEVAVSLKKAIVEQKETLGSIEIEKEWLRILLENEAGDSLEEIVEIIDGVSEMMGDKCRERFLTLLPSVSPVTTECLKFHVKAKRSVRLIMMLLTTHINYPTYWTKILKHIISEFQDIAELKFQEYLNLSESDQRIILNSDSMQQYIRGLLKLAEVGMCVSSSCVDAMVKEPLALEAARIIQEFLEKARKSWNIAAICQLV